MKKLASFTILTTIAVNFANAQDVIRVEKLTVEEKQKKEEVTKKETTQEDVKITRQIDLGEILSGIYPEINFMRKASTANDINIRGFMRDNINVLIDGSKIYGACPNRMDPASFHVSSPQIESIQIKEGPFDVENAGSLAAVVNVKTKDPKEGVGGEIGGTYGSFDYRTGYIQGNVGNKFVKVLVGASNQYSKPYESGEGKKVTEYAVYSTPMGLGRYKPQYINDKAFNIDRIWSKVLITPNNNTELKLSYAFENARNVLYPALKMDALYDRTNRFNADFSLKDIGLKLSAYYNEVKHDMRDTFRTTSGNLPYSMKTYAESKMYGVKLSKDINIASVDTTFGVDYYLRNWKADNVQMGGMNKNFGMIPDVDIKNVGFFVKGVKDIQRWTLSAGLRFDYTDSEADKNAISGKNEDFITNRLLTNFSKTDSYPSGYLLAKYNIDKKNNLYIGFGHSVRVPDPIERWIALSGSAPWYGNPNLKPTKNNEVDLGGEFYPFNNLGIRANIFYSDLTDFIYLRQYQAGANCIGTGNTTCTTYQNIDAHIYGADLNLFYGFNEKISLEGGVAYQRGKKDSGQYKDSDLAEIPPLKTRLAVRYDDGKFYGLVEGIYQAKQSNVDTDLKEFETPSYFIMNVKAGYTYGNKLFVGVGVDNLFDRLYYNYLSYVRDPFRGISVSGNPVKIPEPGRFIYANVSYRF
ncbi:MAG: TonB-dependent receptor [Hydrogenothermaceae bacterium]